LVRQFNRDPGLDHNSFSADINKRQRRVVLGHWRCLRTRALQSVDPRIQMPGRNIVLPSEVHDHALTQAA
jgi:hypothetical protein